MADFRRWIFALAVVALLAGLSVPACANTPPIRSPVGLDQQFADRDALVKLGSAVSADTDALFRPDMEQIFIENPLWQDVMACNILLPVVAKEEDFDTGVVIAAGGIFDEPTIEDSPMVFPTNQ